MNPLVVKLNAAGDVVRTTTLLRRFREHVTWITADANVELFDHSRPGFRAFSVTAAAPRMHNIWPRNWSSAIA